MTSPARSGRVTVEADKELTGSNWKKALMYEWKGALSGTASSTLVSTVGASELRPEVGQCSCKAAWSSSTASLGLATDASSGVSKVDFTMWRGAT